MLGKPGVERETLLRGPWLERQQRVEGHAAFLFPGWSAQDSAAAVDHKPLARAGGLESVPNVPSDCCGGPERGRLIPMPHVGCQMLKVG